MSKTKDKTTANLHAHTLMAVGIACRCCCLMLCLMIMFYFRAAHFFPLLLFICRCTHDIYQQESIVYNFDLSTYIYQIPFSHIYIDLSTHPHTDRQRPSPLQTLNQPCAAAPPPSFCPSFSSFVARLSLPFLPLFPLLPPPPPLFLFMPQQQQTPPPPPPPPPLPLIMNIDLFGSSPWCGTSSVALWPS